MPRHTDGMYVFNMQNTCHCRLWNVLGQLSRQVLWGGCVPKKAEILQWRFAMLFLDGNFVLKLEERP